MADGTRMTISVEGGEPVEVTTEGLAKVAQSLMQEAEFASGSVAADELRQFVERIEHIEAEQRDLADDKKEIYAEAKGRGYMVMAIRKIVAMRRRDKDDLAEEEAIIDLYKSALGMD